MNNIGHNNPPTPFDDAINSLDGLYMEAAHWVDGTPVLTQTDADNIGKLTDAARKLKNQIDALRVDEKKPFDEGAKAVQEKYKPHLVRCEVLIDTCKKALTPYLIKLEDEKRERERIAREEAERLHKEAQDALRASVSAQAQNIEQRERAEAMVISAKEAEAAANRVSKEKTQARTGGRSMSLRTETRVEVTDLREAARYYWKVREQDFLALVTSFAKQDVANGRREIPGVVVTEIKVAV